MPSEVSAVIDPRTLLDALDDPALVIDARGFVLCQNGRAERLRAEGAAPLPLPPEGDRLALPSKEGKAQPPGGGLARLHAVLEGEVPRVEIELPGDVPGAVRWTLVATPCPVNGGAGALLRLRDLGARDEARTTEASLRSAQLFLDAVIEHLPLMIFVKDGKEHRYVRMNKLFEEFYGATRQQLIGKSSYDLLPKEQADLVVAQDNAILAEGKILEVAEQIITTPARGTRLVHSWKIPMPDPEGANHYLLGIFDDITERKKMEDAARHELILLETQNRLLEVIRELSTPILPIHPGILVVPLVGQMDSSRSAQFMETLLAGIQRHRAEMVLIDITGVSVVDSAVANHLLQSTRAAALLGASCVLVGSSPAVATAMITLGVDFGGLATHRDLEAGFRHALACKGCVIVTRASAR